jgi:hypothetical protein
LINGSTHANTKEVKMSEDTKVSAEIPEAVVQEIHAANEAIKGMGKEDLLQFCAERGEEYKPEDVNEGFLRRKATRLARSEVLKGAGIEESKGAPEATETDAPKKKGGRKKMQTKGDFAIVLKEGQSAGREGSTKFKIVDDLRELDKFDHARFKVAVVKAMQWTEADGFGITTKFPTIEGATSAWFSELKNKQEIVQPVGGQDTPADDSVEPPAVE